MEKNWYVVHTYSGYENKVKLNLEKRIESMGMEDKIFGVICSRRGRNRSQKWQKKDIFKEGVSWVRFDRNDYDG